MAVDRDHLPAQTNRVLIEGQIGPKDFVVYPAKPDEKKRALVSFEIRRGPDWFLVQAYDDVGEAALAEGLSPGDRVFIEGALRATRSKGRCGFTHRFTNIVASRVTRIERPVAPGEFDDAAVGMGPPPEVF